MSACLVNSSTHLPFQTILDSLEKLETLVQKARENLTRRERLVLDRERKKLKNRVVELVRDLDQGFSEADTTLRRLFEQGNFAKANDSTAPDPAAEENLVQKSRHLLQLALLGQTDKTYLKTLCPDYKLLVNRYLHLVQVGELSSLGIRQGIQDCLGEILGLIKDKPNRQNR